MSFFVPGHIWLKLSELSGQVTSYTHLQDSTAEFVGP